jgi:hypothetical protein
MMSEILGGLPGRRPYRPKMPLFQQKLSRIVASEQRITLQMRLEGYRQE